MDFIQWDGREAFGGRFFGAQWVYFLCPCGWWQVGGGCCSATVVKLVIDHNLSLAQQREEIKRSPRRAAVLQKLIYSKDVRRK
jgi:hypothetical protein